jgi:hypothetical protein
MSDPTLKKLHKMRIFPVLLYSTHVKIAPLTEATSSNIPPHLRIIQLNVNKSNACQTDFLINRLHPNNYDLVMIQEPYFDYKKDSRVSSKWIAIYPLNHHDNPLRTRSMILVNANISSNSWTALSIDSPDITAIQINGEWGSLRIFNIYNDQNHSQNTTALNRYLLTSESDQRTTESPEPDDIWLGDFNRHSPMWDEARNSQLFTRAALREAQRLIDLAVTWNMHMALRPGVNTLESTSLQAQKTTRAPTTYGSAIQSGTTSSSAMYCHRNAPYARTTYQLSPP